jgi:uncharacterized protein YqeY
MFNDNQAFMSRLRTDLLEARRARDQLTTATLQAVISAIDNAGAVPASENTASIGVGSTEAPRRELSEQDLQNIVKNEIIELKQAIREFGDVKSPYANELNDKITILEKYL